MSVGTSVTPIVQHSRILGRWTNSQYYRGHVTNIGHKIDVQFDDGDRISHDPSDVSAVIYDVNPQLGDIQVRGIECPIDFAKFESFYIFKIIVISITKSIEQAISQSIFLAHSCKNMCVPSICGGPWWCTHFVFIIINFKRTPRLRFAQKLRTN